MRLFKAAKASPPQAKFYNLTTGQGGTMTPGPIDFWGPMDFRKGSWAWEGHIKKTLRNRNEALKTFFFWRTPIFDRKTVRNSVKTYFFVFVLENTYFRPKNRQKFGEDLFFCFCFGEHLFSTGKAVRNSVKTFFFVFVLENTYFRPEKPLEIRWRPFFLFLFWRTPIFDRKSR